MPIAAFPDRTLAAALLIGSALVFLVPGTMFTARVLLNQPFAQSAGFLVLERAFVIAVFLISAGGFALLESALTASGLTAFGRIALMLVVLSAAVLLVSETLWLDDRKWVPPLIGAHVVLAFLGQAAFGVTLLMTGMTAAWVGWAAIIWSLGCLVVLATVWRGDFYYPWLFYPVPLLIGIALLTKRG